MPTSGTNVTTALIITSGATAAYLLWGLMTKRGDRRPPGPCQLPIVGNLVELMSNLNKLPLIFNCWADKYGPIYVVALGGVNAVIVNTMDLAGEVMSKHFI